MRQIWFILCMTLVLSFGLTACTVGEETQKKITALVEKQATLSKELIQAYESYKTGELTVGELKTLKDDLEKNINDTKTEVLKLKESGVGWMELAVSVFIGVISRGIPSKGPLSMLFGAFTARREAET